MGIPFFLRTVVLTAVLQTATAFAVTWEEQAERLQLVSATLLDGVPFNNPVTKSFSLHVQFPISFLPKVDPTVGAKSEKVPSSPVHTIPTLKLSTFVGRSNLFDLGIQVWGGYLMPGAERVVGIDASLSQTAFGGAIVPSKKFANINVYLTIGGQISDAQLKGGITGSGTHDKFRAQSTLVFLSPGFYSETRGLWGCLTIGEKTTDSRFEIPSDSTVFELTDTLEDAKFQYFVQASAGLNFPSGIQLGVAHLWVPNRLMMPRLLLAYEIFGR